MIPSKPRHERFRKRRRQLEHALMRLTSEARCGDPEAKDALRIVQAELRKLDASGRPDGRRGAA
jgi:hypothetical protein